MIYIRKKEDQRGMDDTRNNKKPKKTKTAILQHTEEKKLQSNSPQIQGV